MRISACDLGYSILPLAVRQNKKRIKVQKPNSIQRVPYNKGNTSRTYSWEAEPKLFYCTFPAWYRQLAACFQAHMFQDYAFWSLSATWESISTNLFKCHRHISQLKWQR